jgi:hypothetical protein
MFGGVPFRDLTENHINILNKENQTTHHQIKGQGPSFNVSFGKFPKFDLNFNNMTGSQPLNSPIGIKNGLDIISSLKKTDISAQNEHL